jgi:hypothetical protein
MSFNFCRFLVFIQAIWPLVEKVVNDNVYYYIQLFQLRLSTSKAEKSNTSAKGCWEPLWKFINLLAIPSSLSRSYSTFPLCCHKILLFSSIWNLSDQLSLFGIKTWSILLVKKVLWWSIGKLCLAIIPPTFSVKS